MVALRSRALAALSGRGGDARGRRPGSGGAASPERRPAVGGGGERPGGHRGLAATRPGSRSCRPACAPAEVRARRAPGGLRLPQPRRSSRSGTSPGRPWHGITPGPGTGPDDLRDHWGVLTAPGGRGVLVRELAWPGEFAGAVSALARLRAPGVRRGVPAPGADRRGHRDPGRGRDNSPGGGGDRHAAPRPYRRRGFLASLARVPARGVKSTGPRSSPARGATGWTCRPTRSSGPATGHGHGPAVAGPGTGTGHPLLGSAVELAGHTPGFTGPPLGAADSPGWPILLAGPVLLPGTAFAEMAVRPATGPGCGPVAEAALHAPLVMPGRRHGACPAGDGRPGRGGTRALARACPPWQQQEHMGRARQRRRPPPPGTPLSRKPTA